MDVAYYDFMLIGSSGQGKTTLGNKLLQRKETTAPFELLTNEATNVRVLDVPGFSDSSTANQSGQRVTAYARKMQILCQQVPRMKNLKVRRVVYFLPVRGALEKADGSLQKELQVMHHFFGPNVINCMVVIATNHPRQQQLGFDKDELKQTEKVFHLALKCALGDKEVGCPPIVYIGINEMEVMSKLQMAPVLKDHEVLDLESIQFNDDICSYCNITVRYNQKKEILGVVDDTNTMICYESKCHPHFVPKYTTWQKVAGTITHIVTLGLMLVLAQYVIGVETWPPGLLNSDEICIACGRPPRSPGCRNVNEDIECDWRSDVTAPVQVFHKH